MNAEKGTGKLMNRQLFMEELKRKLKRLPVEEFDSAVSFYNEYFDEAGPENEQNVIGQLGTPADVAAKIICEFAYKSTDDDSSYGQPFFIKKQTALNLLQFHAV